MTHQHISTRLGRSPYSSNDLPEATTEKIRGLCEEGYQLFDAGDLKAALRKFYSAWNLLPKPQTMWRESGWILTALGDTYFVKGDYSSGKEALNSALHCPHTNENPFIYLRLGQCYFELDKRDEAREAFQRVIEYGGEEMFSKEKKKYLRLLTYYSSYSSTFTHPEPNTHSSDQESITQYSDSSGS